MKTVWITGASRGIGAACARRFAAQGWQVALGYCTQKEKAEALAAELNATAPHTALAVHTDVRDAAGVREAAAAIQKAFGSIDCLVNNAGIARQQLFTDVSEADWDEMFDITCKGMYRTVQAVLPGMLHKKSGSIVNISIAASSIDRNFFILSTSFMLFGTAVTYKTKAAGNSFPSAAQFTIVTEIHSHTCSIPCLRSVATWSSARE